MEETRRKHTDRRVLRTRKAIMNAFKKLASERDFNKITVSAIAREADIDRKTFYLHYGSVSELANRITEEALEQVVERLRSEGTGKPFAEQVHIALSEVNAIFMANIALYSNIASSLSIDQMLERFEAATTPSLAQTSLNPEIIENKQMRMSLQFYIAGALSLYSTWLQSDRTEPIESVSNVIEQAIAPLYRRQ